MKSQKLKSPEWRTGTGIAGDGASDDENPGADGRADAKEYKVKHAEATDEAVAWVRTDAGIG